ncbi:MAG: hypothetical protein J3R72DRAFT_494732 [Linnemannia gamsii]|nr:MAG: hypothetical protein J3R72DRAFT_494732 [Linnemannia gamsii]
MSSTPRASRKRPVSALQPLLINDTEDGGSKRRNTERGGKAVTAQATNEAQRFETTGTTAGTLVRDLRDEIAAYINDNSEDRGKDGWKPWTGYHVKYNKTACEAKYRRARDLMNKIGCDDDETTTLEEQVRKICPIDESNSDEGDESDENNEGDEDDEGHGHVQLEGFDLEKSFGTSDDNVETRTTNSTTAPARLSQQKKQDKENASKDRGKIVEACLRISEKLDAIMQERGGIMGFLPWTGLMYNVEKNTIENWQKEKEWWREQMQKDMDMIQEQKEKLFQERCQFLQQQAGRKPIPTIQQTFNIITTRSP